MTAQDAGVDSAYRQQVVETMTTILADLLERSEPITEDLRLMEELGLSSTLGLELLLSLEDQLQILIDVELLGQEGGQPWRLYVEKEVIPGQPLTLEN